ncbi:MAG: BREX-1 system phosphatase PglZ type B, partial [Deltaproteobacteria bacterium]
KRYPNIPAQIRKCQPPQPTLFSDASTYSGWPQWNEDQEASLRKELASLDSLPPHEGRKRIGEYDARHRDRRNLVWAELGEAPLACALEHLAALAEVTSHSLAAGTAEDLATGYRSFGWKADDAVLHALACVEKQDDLQAVTTVVRSIYLPWAEESARHLQHTVDSNGYPGKTISAQSVLPKKSGECILFVDGLRFDAARRLAVLLDKAGLQVNERIVWAALPSVTATGKPAVTPVKHLIRGELTSADFEPSVAETGQPLKGGYHLKKLLIDNGWSILDKSEVGDGSGCAWCEFGDIDHEGHDRGWKLAKHLDGILSEIKDRVESLISAGWKSVRIVTDHGWLLMPGGLPKIDLPGELTENKWGRCAAIKPGANTDERLFPWYWNPNQYFALANGISCYRKGEEYAHGGLSLQECLTLELTVSARDGGRTSSGSIEITDVVWRGLRCKVAVEGDVSPLFLDVRKQAGNSSTSVVMSVKQIKAGGIGSVVVEDEELEGTDAAVVLLDVDGEIKAQVMTVIGGGNT